MQVGKHNELEKIWEEVIRLILEKMYEICQSQTSEGYHRSLRAELIWECAKLQFWLRERIINGRDMNSISIDEERNACFNEIGLEKIANTAKMIAERIWMKKYKERWHQKTIKALEKEALKGALKPLQVDSSKQDNHFIPLFFLKKYWAFNNKLTIHNIDNKSKKTVGVGQWGFKKKLYLPRLEAYFSLIECDAEKPLRLIQNSIPLSAKDIEALTGFIVVQLLRNPCFLDVLYSSMRPVIMNMQRVDKANDQQYMKEVYATIYGNNHLYADIATHIIENKWIVIESCSPSFILPDAFCVVHPYGNSRLHIMPLTPHRVFVVLPHKDDGERIEDIRLFVPKLNASPELVKKISRLQIAAAKTEFVAHHDFLFEEHLESVDLTEIINTIESERLKKYSF